MNRAGVAAGIAAMTMVCLSSNRAQAAKVFEVSGKVAMADGVVPRGVTARLQVDLDRNGKFSPFETLTATADEQGTFRLSYDLDPTKVDLTFVRFVTQLLAEYNAKGFEALTEPGPLPVVLSFEKEGYSTVVRRLSTLLQNPLLEVMLEPLDAVGCDSTGCRSRGGTVKVGGFPGGTGIARGFAQAYDPSENGPSFPGAFTDVSENLLISSGFMEIDFRDSSGKKITQLSSPVTVRFEAKPTSWPTLIDLVPNSGRIEVPMYSFDETKGDWVAEQDGVLENDQGVQIPEAELASIQAGSHTGALFIAFSTSHFSSWNCDKPVSTRTCVKGRVVDESGVPLAGQSVGVSGITYTGGTSAMVTGVDGTFASDLMKSEAADEDVDRNGKRGETFMARVNVRGAAGVFFGNAFATPAIQKSIGNIPRCKPAACDCIDLGDVVVKFEPPRLCEVRVTATVSGQSSSSSSLEAGAALSGAKIRGKLSGEMAVPVSAAQALCAGKACGSVTTAADGSASFFIPVLGESPKVQLDVTYSEMRDGKAQDYIGSVTIDGCINGVATLAGTVQLEASHVSLEGLASFITALGPAVSSGSSGGSGTGGGPKSGSRRGCQAGAYTTGAFHSGVIGSALAIGLLGLRRLRRKTCTSK